MKSSYLTLNLKDLLKGFVVAFLSSALTALLVVFENSALPTLDELQKAGIVGLTAGLSYLVKNLFTNNQDEFLKSDV